MEASFFSCRLLRFLCARRCRISIGQGAFLRRAVAAAATGSNISKRKLPASLKRTRGDDEVEKYTKRAARFTKQDKERVEWNIYTSCVPFAPLASGADRTPT